MSQARELGEEGEAFEEVFFGADCDRFSGFAGQVGDDGAEVVQGGWGEAEGAQATARFARSSLS